MICKLHFCSVYSRLFAKCQYVIFMCFHVLLPSLGWTTLRLSSTGDYSAPSVLASCLT